VLLEYAREMEVGRFVFGSSSSVYGNSSDVPFSEDHSVGRPISPYAATKRQAELLCHVYHHLFGLGIVALRFFTVYGPRQRPDLAIHRFTRLLSEGKPIQQYGAGGTSRDYTYVDDIVQGVEGAIRYLEAAPDAYEIVNLGESETVELSRLIGLIADELGVTPEIERLPPQPGDVEQTFADISKARRLLAYDPRVGIAEGIVRFVRWYSERA
jgi:UDP-glucuronate 4-epimerase